MRRRYQVRWGSIYVSKPTRGRNRNGINIMVDANGVTRATFLFNAAHDLDQ